MYLVIRAASRRLLVPVCAAGALFTGAATAQPPSNWTTVTMPANAVAPPNQIGTTVSIQTTNSVWLYSGITKVWTVLPTVNPSLVFQANDYIVVQDGNLLHGYASHRGTVDTITTPTANPTIVSGPASSSWVTLVADGPRAWAFGAFHGQWETTPLSQPNPAMVANRLTGLLRDGSTVYGVSAHHGAFVPVAADVLATLVTTNEAELGTANSPGIIRAFSAQQNNWTVQAIPVTATILQSAELCLAFQGNQIWGFSGITGTVDVLNAASPITDVQTTDGVAAFKAGALVGCYATGTGRFVTLAAQNPTFHLDYHFAIVVESGLVLTPFSSVTGAFGTPIVGSFNLTSNEAIAYAQSTSATSYAYSPLLNTWIASLAAAPTSIELVRDAVVLIYPGGYAALSARHGHWVSQATTLQGWFVTSTRGSTFVALDGAGEIAHVFDARLDRWATIVGQSPLSVNISRHTAMAHDNQFGYGFGQPSGEWYTEPLTAAPTSFRTSSSIGAIEHGSKLSVYSVQGSFSYTGRYPEFTQAINLGNTLRLHQIAPAGSQLALLVGFAPARIDFGIAGHLYIDPTLMIALPWGAPVGASGDAELAFTVPLDPTLRHAQLHFQNIVLPPAQAPWLSTSVAPILF